MEPNYTPIPGDPPNINDKNIINPYNAAFKAPDSKIPNAIANDNFIQNLKLIFILPLSVVCI